MNTITSRDQLKPIRGVNRDMQICGCVLFFHQIHQSAHNFVQIWNSNHIQKQKCKNWKKKVIWWMWMHAWWLYHSTIPMTVSHVSLNELRLKKEIVIFCSKTLFDVFCNLSSTIFLITATYAVPDLLDVLFAIFCVTFWHLPNLVHHCLHDSASK